MYPIAPCRHWYTSMIASYTMRTSLEVDELFLKFSPLVLSTAVSTTVSAVPGCTVTTGLNLYGRTRVSLISSTSVTLLSKVARVAFEPFNTRTMNLPASEQKYFFDYINKM